MATVFSVYTRPSVAPASEGLSALEREMVTVFADIGQALGLPKSYGEIYGLLYASAEPLSFADIEIKLELSKGSVSQGLKALREIGAVRRVDGVAARLQTTDHGQRDDERTTEDRGPSFAEPSSYGGAPADRTAGRGHDGGRSSVDGGRRTVDRGRSTVDGGLSTEDTAPMRETHNDEPGFRAAARSRDYYVPETELRQLVAAILREGIAPRLQANAKRLAGMPELLRAAKLAPAERKLLSGRIEKLQGWRRKASGLLPWITKFLG